MSPDNKASVAPEEEVVSLKGEVVRLLDEIDRISLQDVDEPLNVAVSDTVSYLYNGDSFGIHAYKRFYSDGSATRGVILNAHSSVDHAIPHHPPIFSELVVEYSGKILVEDDIEAGEVKDSATLNQQIGVLRFLKRRLELPSGNNQLLTIIPDEVSDLTEDLWKSNEMEFERAKAEFYEAAGPVRRKTRKVRSNPNKYEEMGADVTRQTKWVAVQVNGKPQMVRYQKYDAYSNGSWTDFERVQLKDSETGAERTYLEFGDISRIGSLDFFGTHVRTAEEVKKRTKILRDMNTALEVDKAK